MIFEKNSSVQTNKQRFSAAVLCAVVLFVMLFSSVYVIKNAEHTCTGDDCTICSFIQSCEENLNRSVRTASHCLPSAAVVHLIATMLIPTGCICVCITLVTQKVRLDN